MTRPPRGRAETRGDAARFDFIFRHLKQRFLHYKPRILTIMRDLFASRATARSKDGRGERRGKVIPVDERELPAPAEGAGLLPGKIGRVSIILLSALDYIS